MDTTSTARIQQDKISPAAVTNKIGVSPKYRHNRVGAVGEEGVEDQDDMAPETGPPGKPSISSDPDRGDPTTKEREDHNATHIPFCSWCPICVKAKWRRRTEMEEVKRGVERPQFHSITNLLAKRTIVMTRQQPLCTQTITPT